MPISPSVSARVDDDPTIFVSVDRDERPVQPPARGALDVDRRLGRDPVALPRRRRSSRAAAGRLFCRSNPIAAAFVTLVSSPRTGLGGCAKRVAADP
jgi:hypothetical protein